MSDDISCDEVKRRIESGERFHFFDVREQWEHEEQNIGADCYPLGELPEYLDVLSHLKNDEIVIHCKTGPRGNRAKKYLTSQGFTNVRNMTGGITAYLEIQELQQPKAED